MRKTLQQLRAEERDAWHAYYSFGPVRYGTLRARRKTEAFMRHAAIMVKIATESKRRALWARRRESCESFKSATRARGTTRPKGTPPGAPA